MVNSYEMTTRLLSSILVLIQFLSIEQTLHRHRNFHLTPNKQSGLPRPYQYFHNENKPMQYTAIFHGCKNGNFQLNLFDYFHIFAQNIYCGYTLEPPD